MILVKKRYLFTMTLIFCLLVVFGEIKFFMAIQSINQNTNLELKYEIENFIFATIVVLLLGSVFFVGFIRGSENILKRMDKMIQLSDYGKHDVSAHLERLGRIGKKVNYLTYNLNNLNEMRMKKISSLSEIIDFLMGRSGDMILLTDPTGKVLDCSKKLTQEFKTESKYVEGRNLNDFLVEEDFDDIFHSLQKKRSAVEKEKLHVRIGSHDKRKKSIFLPVMNVDNEVSNVIAILGGEGHFALFK